MSKGPVKFSAMIGFLVGTMMIAVLHLGGVGGCGGGAAAGGGGGGEDLDVSGADLKRGGRLYDSWFGETDADDTPTSDFPLYAETTGTQTGTATWRCKECHGWDYQGAAGAYATGSHATGVAGVLNHGLTNQELFDALQNATTGHDFSGVLADADLLDLVRFLSEGLIDTSSYITTGKVAQGDAATGQTLFEGTAQCSICHGADGKTINFGSDAEPEYVGTVASDNPWEGLHKIRWGHPGSIMPSGVVDTELTTQEQVDVLTHAQTLPAL